jgi:hypothetical protein
VSSNHLVIALPVWRALVYVDKGIFAVMCPFLHARANLAFLIYNMILKFGSTSERCIFFLYHDVQTSSGSNYQRGMRNSLSKKKKLKSEANHQHHRVPHLGCHTVCLFHLLLLNMGMSTSCISANVFIFSCRLPCLTEGSMSVVYHFTDLTGWCNIHDTFWSG